MSRQVVVLKPENKKMLELTCKPSDLNTRDVIEHVLVKDGLLSKKEAEDMVRHPIDLREYLFVERPSYLSEQESLDFVFMNKAPSIPNEWMINEFYKLLKPRQYVVMAVDMRRNETSKSDLYTGPLTSGAISIIKEIYTFSKKLPKGILKRLPEGISNPIEKRSTPALTVRKMYESAMRKIGFSNFKFRISGDYFILYAQK